MTMTWLLNSTPYTDTDRYNKYTLHRYCHKWMERKNIMQQVLSYDEKAVEARILEHHQMHNKLDTSETWPLLDSPCPAKSNSKLKKADVSGEPDADHLQLSPNGLVNAIFNEAVQNDGDTLDDAMNENTRFNMY